MPLPIMNWIEFQNLGEGLFELAVNGNPQRILVEAWEIHYVEALVQPHVNLPEEYFRLLAVGAVRITKQTPKEVIDGCMERDVGRSDLPARNEEA